jgi:hypothetical protein
MKKLIEYIYWCTAHIHYKHFEESGEIGKITLSIITFFGIIDILTFIRVLFYNHTSFVVVFGQVNVSYFKIIGLIVMILIYLCFYFYFKNYPIKTNKQFKNVSKTKRFFHTILIFLFFLLELYAFMIFLSPSFNPL